MALADPQREFLSLHNGVAVTGEGTGTNEHGLPLTDSVVFTSQYPLLGLLFGFLCVLGVEVIVATSQLLQAGPGLQRETLCRITGAAETWGNEILPLPLFASSLPQEDRSEPVCERNQMGGEGFRVDAGMREWEMDGE